MQIEFRIFRTKFSLFHEILCFAKLALTCKTLFRILRNKTFKMRNETKLQHRTKKHCSFVRFENQLCIPHLKIIFLFLFILFISVLVSYLHNKIKKPTRHARDYCTTFPFLLSSISPVPHTFCPDSEPSFPVSILSCFPSFLYPFRPGSLYSCIRPALNPSFPSYLISFIHLFLPFLLPYFPASRHYCIPPFQHLYCSSSLLS